MSLDGLDADTVFNAPCLGYEYDDLVCLPGYATHGTEEVVLSTRFSRNVPLGCPVVSAPMDTVTEGRMALACALSGGIGVVHCACSVEHQVSQVLMVKRYQQGFVAEPLVMSEARTLADVDRLPQEDGVPTVLVTDTGALGGKLLGIVTARDAEPVEDRKTTLGVVMTPMSRLKYAAEPITWADAQNQLRQKKVANLPIVNEAERLVGLVTRDSLRCDRTFPSASRDTNHQLVVAAACLPRASEYDRVRRLVEAGADAIVLCAAQGSSEEQVSFTRWMKKEYPSVDLVCGNVVTPRQAKPLLDAGADGLRVGMGCSSLFSGLEACAVGRPQASAVYHVAKLAREYGVPVVADGGIRSSSHVSMALAVGASAVMCGLLLAGTSESPGEAFWHEGQRLKVYRGMGSLELEDGQRLDSGGAELAVVDRGPVSALISSVLESVRRDLRRLNLSNVQQLHQELHESGLRFHVRGVGCEVAARIPTVA